MLGERDIVYVIANNLHRLMVFVRLALVAALAAYTLPTASFAMHGDMSASYAPSVTPETARHVHDAAHSDHDSVHTHDGGDGVHSASADHHPKGSSPDCCSDFCLNLALVTSTTEFGRVASSQPLVHGDDDNVTAEPIGFNRPPTPRA